MFEGVEAAGHLLGIFGYGFFQVTAGRRYSTDEGNGARLAVVQLHVSGTAVEVGMIEDKSIGNASGPGNSSIRLDISRNACAQREVESAISNTFNPMLR